MLTASKAGESWLWLSVHWRGWESSPGRCKPWSERSRMQHQFTIRDLKAHCRYSGKSFLKTEETTDQCPKVNGKSRAVSKWRCFLLLSLWLPKVQAYWSVSPTSRWVFPYQFAGLCVSHLQTHPQLCFSNQLCGSCSSDVDATEIKLNCSTAKETQERWLLSCFTFCPLF